MGWLRSVHEVWNGMADARSYAVLRIGVGVASLLNILELWPHRHAFFSNVGMIDPAEVRTAAGTAPYFSVFYHFNDMAAVDAILAIAAGCAVCLALGLAARPAAVLVYLWHLSYGNMAFPATHGWDVLLRIYSFVLMLSPLGTVWSLDRLWAHKLGFTVRCGVARYGLVLMQCQLLIVYWHTVWLKLGNEYWRQGDFLGYFLLSIYARRPVPEIADYPVLIAIGTFATLALEAALPVLLFSKRWRPVGFVLGYGFHAGIALTSSLAVFSIVVMALYLAFLDGDDIDRVRAALRDGWRAAWRLRLIVNVRPLAEAYDLRRRLLLRASLSRADRGRA